MSADKLTTVMALTENGWKVKYSYQFNNKPEKNPLEKEKIFLEIETQEVDHSMMGETDYYVRNISEIKKQNIWFILKYGLKSGNFGILLDQITENVFEKINNLL